MIAVVIPAYRCRQSILSVISDIGNEVSNIIVVDDACPDKSGEYIEDNCDDARVEVLYHEQNKGVGGAVVTGMLRAIDHEPNIVVKLDSDGQMDPRLIPRFINPIQKSHADYVKGNRFFNISGLSEMPIVRIIGNAGLSFMSKISTGYWSVMDPTNGYFAIHGKVLMALPLEKLSERYFFESDILFRLRTIKACVYEIPMSSVYANETSHLSPFKSMFQFSYLHAVCFIKRFFYDYILRDFNAATLMTFSGLIFLLFGVFFGADQWYQSIQTGRVASTGTVMLAVLPVILGVQLLLFAVQYDMSNEPRRPVHPHL